jgi:fatty acid desaturase
MNEMSKIKRLDKIKGFLKEKMKLKTILFWLGAFMASIGFWMLFAMLTGYPYPIPWWTEVIRKGFLILLLTLCGMLTGLLLVLLIKRKAGLK